MDVPKDDGLKWFGEGFDGFPKRLPEDCVEYSIHIIDTALAELAIRDRLRKIQSAGTALTKKLLKDYIWQREEFGLELVREDGYDILRGTTNFGDSVEDEWVIVYLLKGLSEQFPEAWIKIVDTDGEFLLIEAANALPRWLNPEIADNRVWLNKGHLSIIPNVLAGGKEKQGTSKAGSLTMQEARTVLKDSQSKLLNARLVEEEAFYRLRNYPQQIADNLHHSLVTIPRKVAYVLHERPSIINQVVEAFYLRDPVALRPLQNPDASVLNFAPEDFVTVQVRFNKVGYAQLKSQQFAIPSTWKKAASSGHDAKSSSRAEMGAKVSCGLEMLVSDPQNQDKRSVREIKLMLGDLQSGDELLPTDEKIATWNSTEDDEVWLDINFTDFEAELNGRQRGNKKNGSASGFGDKSAHENLQKMVSRFEDFLNEDELDDMDEDDEESVASSDNRKDPDEDKDANFDEDEFTAMMREMMGMPPETMQEIMGPHANKVKGLMDQKGGVGRKGATIDPIKATKSRDTTTAAGADDAEVRNASDDDDDDEEEIRQLSAAMEAELKRAGALSLEDPNAAPSSSSSFPPPMKKNISTKQKSTGKSPSTKKPPAKTQTNNTNPLKTQTQTLTNRADKGKQRKENENEDEEDNEDTDDNNDDDDSDAELLDSDYNLVANLLESFKSQAGMAGPGGNMLGMMGMHLPRDEGEDGDER